MNTEPSLIKTLGILLFPDFETLDVFGPLEMFGNLPGKISVVMISEHQGLVKSAQGQAVLTDYNWQNAPHLDFLLVPGDIGTRREVNNLPLLDWIKLRSANTEITLSVCTGAALLAKAGVLDGHKATTNKLAFNWVVEQGSQVEWVKQARWVDDGHVITSSGVSAGIDMSLYVVSRLFGENTRDQLARHAEYIVCNDCCIDPFMVV